MHSKLTELPRVLRRASLSLADLPPDSAVVVHMLLLSPMRKMREHSHFIICRKDGRHLAFFKTTQTGVWKAERMDRRDLAANGDWVQKFVDIAQKRVEKFLRKFCGDDIEKVSVDFSKTTVERVASVTRYRDDSLLNQDKPLYEIVFVGGAPAIKHQNVA